MTKRRLTAADFFCGGGGFSEGFRQNDFELLFALDSWQPAIDTHHLNHPDCNAVRMDILEIDTPEKIDEFVPDVDVLIGSPPCVSFSGSNKAGKADKSLGIKLIEAYLRIVAWKKSKGQLKYWLLENVPNAGSYVKDKYTWKELGLPGDGPDLVVERKEVFNAAYYGAPQARKRFVCGDFPLPEPTCKDASEFTTTRHVLEALRNPFEKDHSGTITDPSYGLSVAADSLTDHFYDTRVADFEWKKARRMKEDHGFMGKMSFPEDLDRPSRTVMATMSASTRESMILEAMDENGEHIGYRLPTIREIASFMSFPITYQFQANNESSKYRLVGNAVCSRLSSALAKAILIKEGIEPPEEFIPLPDTRPNVDLRGTKRKLKTQGRKKPDAKFAIHIPYIKIRGFRVELSNKDSDFEKGNIKWSCILHQGSGKNALMCRPDECDLTEIVDQIPGFDEFKEDVHERFSEFDMDHTHLQEAYVARCESEYISPEQALHIMKELVDKHFPDEDAFVNNSNGTIAIERDRVPVRVIAGMYACDYFVECLD
ncbi:DNA cytosine methyltransferase [Methanolobus profundi]|uniref:DNA (cytosine-5-)-methyltransferase n=1 Tax=Methanolobus profundi TaxID=487685 RepID=A0A1I4RAY6_9EURY|nr:DNA cytosine methyltransferase [Methanolobus profundi]SFM49365.1 DNA (cytosine-5)-methyltransferase 1 [Methanolobus profundi]